MPAPQDETDSAPADPAGVTLMAVLGGFLLYAVVSLLLGRCGPANLVLERPPANRFAYRVDVNTATKTELLHLPGIGPKLADRILAERATRPFENAADLQRVAGLGPRKVADLEPYLRWPGP